MFAALDELEIAPAIVHGLFYALLIAIVGSVVVAFGGGGIPVAREYLARWSVRASDTAREIRENADVDAGSREAAQVMASASPRRLRRRGEAVPVPIVEDWATAWSRKEGLSR